MIVIEGLNKKDLEKCKQFFRDNPKRKVVRIKTGDKVYVIKREDIMKRKKGAILGVDICD